ncbi:MAG: hypothetical protein HFI63_09555 [Lachnospiraceae bacterium]|nr:hypothetical protein [Lachnospiraceae bacterium]
MKHRFIKDKNRKPAKVERLNVKYLNGKSKQLLALILGGSLVFGMTGAGAYAAGMRKGEGPGPEVIETAEKNGQENSSGEKQEGRVEETVYVIAGADGTTQKIIVSDWMKAANGEDTYTKESLEKELPVELAVTYKLDGKTMTAEEIAGKSGKLTMRFDYTNQAYEDVEIDGEVRRIYVPFVMMTGMVLDNERFSGVEVSNGRVINDGERTIVAGFAVPGLQESLDLDREKMELPDFVEVTAQVTDFKLETTMTLATTEIFQELDLDQESALDELDDSMEKLMDAMEELTDGSSALYEGLDTLLDKSGELSEGIGMLHSGAEALMTGAGDLEVGAGDLHSGAGELKEGAEALRSGIQTVKAGTETLKAGASELKDGLGQLAANNDTLNGGAGQVFDSLLAAANSQIQTAGLSLPALTRENYGEVLEGAIGSFNENVVREQALEIARNQVEAKVREQTGTVRTGVEAAVRQQVLQAVLGQAGMDEATYQALTDAAAAGDGNAAASLAQISGAIEAQMGSGEIQEKISQATEGKIQELIAQNMESENVTAQIEAAVLNARTGATSLAALKSQLDSYHQFYQGLLTYTAGVASANEGADRLASGAGELAGGASQLSEGAGQLAEGVIRLEEGAGQLENGAMQLSDGADTLYVGIGTLRNGSGALIDGVTQLKDGAMQLSDGVKKLKEEGIEALVDAFDGEVKDLKDRMGAVSDVAKNYRSFKDHAGNTGESVRFIYKTEKIGEE